MKRRCGAAGILAGFFSGSGSHSPQITGGYVRAIVERLSRFPQKPDVIDLGCGDLNIGRQVRSLCAGYIACDVVPALIERNRQAFDDLDVDFHRPDCASIQSAHKVSAKYL